jgi:hypothetical protein
MAVRLELIRRCVSPTLVTRTPGASAKTFLAAAARIARRPHQHDLRRRVAGLLGEIVGVGDEERVAGRRRKLAGDADEAERHDVILMVGGALESQIEGVARLKLKIADRLLRHENAIARRGERAKRARAASAAEKGVGHVGRPVDRARIDAIHVLQVRADIGEAVHHRLGRRDARQAGKLGESLPSRAPGDADGGDVGAVGEFSVDPRLGVVSRVEHGRRNGEADCASGERDGTGKGAAPPCEHVRHQRREAGGERAQPARPQCPAASEPDPDAPLRQKARSEPETDRRKEGRVVDGGLRHALGREHHLVARSRAVPEGDGAGGNEGDIEPQPSRRGGETSVRRRFGRRRPSARASSAKRAPAPPRGRATGRRAPQAPTAPPPTFPDW